MPVVSMFYGIVVLMYYFDNKKHRQPHARTAQVMRRMKRALNISYSCCEIFR